MCQGLTSRGLSHPGLRSLANLSLRVSRLLPAVYCKSDVATTPRARKRKLLPHPGHEGGPQLVIRGEHPWLVSSRQAMPVLPRRRHEIRQPVQEVTRGEFDDAVGTWIAPEAGIQRLLQRQVNQAVPKLVHGHARQTEFGVLDHPTYRRALGRKQHPAEGNALPLPPVSAIHRPSAGPPSPLARYGRRSACAEAPLKLPRHMHVHGNGQRHGAGHPLRPWAVARRRRSSSREMDSGPRARSARALPASIAATMLSWWS
jgi:hypothetical protein